MKQIIPTKEDCWICNATGFLPMIEINEWNEEYCYESLCVICHGQKYLNIMKIVDIDIILPPGRNINVEGQL
jgi:hypothetical protein